MATRVFYLLSLLSVASPGSRSSCNRGYVEVTGSSGYLANTVTRHTQIGGAGCPWVIHVPKGQRVNITLLDFSTSEAPERASNLCALYANIREDRRGATEVTVCGGEKREKPIFLSETNTVQVTINSEQAATSNFVLKYQGKGVLHGERKKIISGILLK